MPDGGSLDAWCQWREACALARTPPGARADLTRFLAARFHLLVRRLGATRPPDDATCAHLFESWCALHARADGKRYKDWLLTRGDGSHGAVESGATLLLRKVVLEWVRMELQREPTVSLDRPLSESDPSFTLADLLPDAPDEPLFEEEDWIRRELPRIKAEMTGPQRIAAAARAGGLRFSDTRVREMAGVEKSTLYNHYKDWVLRVGEQVRDAFPHEGPERGLQMTLRVLEIISSEIFPNFFPENLEHAGCGEGRNPS